MRSCSSAVRQRRVRASAEALAPLMSSLPPRCRNVSAVRLLSGASTPGAFKGALPSGRRRCASRVRRPKAAASSPASFTLAWLADASVAVPSSRRVRAAKRRPCAWAVKTASAVPGQCHSQSRRARSAGSAATAKKAQAASCLVCTDTPFRCSVHVRTVCTACIAPAHAMASLEVSSSAPATAWLRITAGCHSSGVRSSCSRSGSRQHRRTASTVSPSGLSSSRCAHLPLGRAALPQAKAPASVLAPSEACCGSGAKRAAAMAAPHGCKSASRKCATCTAAY